MGKNNSKLRLGGIKLKKKPSFSNSSSSSTSIKTSSPYIILPSSMSVSAAANSMAKEKASSIILLTTDKQVDGIVTEQDMVRKALIDTPSQTLDDIKTPNPVCLQNNVDIEEVLALMASKSFRHVPFVDANKTFVDCVDIVSAISSSKTKSLAHSLSFPAGKLMRMYSSLSGGSGEGAACLSSDCIVRDVVRLMIETKRSSLIVKKNNKVVGIVTESDLVRKVLASGKSLSCPVSEVMTKNPLTVSVDINPFDGLETMIQHGFRHLPVLENGNVTLVLDILTLVKMSNVGIREASYLVEQSGVADVARQDGEELDDEPEHVFMPRKSIANPQIRELTSKEREAIKCIMSGSFQEAVKLLSEAIEEENVDKSTLVRFYVRRATVKSCLGLLDEACNDFSVALAEGDGLDDVKDLLIEATRGSCEILIETGRYEEAVRRMLSGLSELDRGENIQQLQNESAKFKDVGKDLFVRRDFAGAISAYTNAIRAQQAISQVATEPMNSLMAILLGNRAACYQCIKDFKYGLEDAEKSLSYDPDYVKSKVRICSCLYELGKFELCLERVNEFDDAGNHAKLQEIKAKAEKQVSSKRDQIKSLGQMFVVANKENQQVNL